MKLLELVNLLEGGNVTIGDQEAQRINLSQVSRDEVAQQIQITLNAINQAYQQQYGQPLWNEELFKSNQFLSGSSLHFFDKNISTDEFARHKGTVGDIDTQVDATQSKEIAEFLDNSTGHHFGAATLVGYKKSAGQYISLWRLDNPKLNVQIDFELVDFAEGKPTNWSQFSHSSSWSDIKEGIKGVFHKYLLRALTRVYSKDFVIEKNKGRGKNKTTVHEVTNSNELAFSVMKGLRNKYAPVLDENGKQKVKDGLPVFKEKPSKGDKYINEPAEIFKMLFRKAGKEQDVKDFNSFVGGLNLINKNLNDNQKQSVINGFINLLWGKGAQQLYKGDPETDNNEKTAAFEKMVSELDVPYQSKQLNQLKDEFYKGYKQ
jgi:hypothetical protein